MSESVAGFEGIELAFIFRFNDGRLEVVFSVSFRQSLLYMTLSFSFGPAMAFKCVHKSTNHPEEIGHEASP